MVLISVFFFVDSALISLLFVGWPGFLCFLNGFGMDFLLFFRTLGIDAFASCWMALISVFFFCGLGVGFRVFLVDLALTSLLCAGWH